MSIELYPNIVKVKRDNVWQNLPGFGMESADNEAQAMIANAETSTSAQYAHPEGSYFRLNGVLYQADESIRVNDIIAVGVNCHVAVLSNDVEKNTNDIENLTNDFDNLEDILTTDIALTTGSYYKNNGAYLGEITASNSYACALINVHEGEIYAINGTGANAARLWSTNKANGEIVRVADVNASATGAPVIITIAEGETQLCYNTQRWVSSNNAVKRIGRQAPYAPLEPYKYILKTIKNNLLSDGIENLPNVKIYKNGSESPNNYGDDNVYYQFSLPGNDSLHLYFEYQFTGIVPKETNPYMALCNIYNGSVQIGIEQVSALFTNGNLYRESYLMQRTNIGLKSLSVGGNANFKPFNGKDAIWIKYDGTVTSESSVIVTFTATSCTVSVGGETIGTVSFAGTDDIETLLTGLNALTDISAGAVNTTGYKCADLLPVVCPQEINLVTAWTNVSSVTAYDNPKIYIPLAYDPEWHTIEVILDKANNKSYVAFDGYLNEQSITTINDNKTIIIGGAFSGSNSPVRLRNLKIDYGHFGDAEIVSSPAYPYSAQNQLISEHNPRLLIFEGHGIVVGTDADVPSGQEILTSTDRLWRVFAELNKVGYKPIDFRDVIDWKLYGKPLPKRCYTIMFDDWQFLNYADYDKRLPFEHYGVKPALAVITSQYALDDTISVNDKSYTAKEIIDMTMKAGWYPSSHTDEHRQLDNSSPSENEELLKDDVLACNDLGIYSNVLTYPNGYFSFVDLPTIRNSGFVIGVDIVNDRYNCARTNPYELTRVELGVRCPLTDVLATIT